MAGRTKLFYVRVLNAETGKPKALFHVRASEASTVQADEEAEWPKGTVKIEVEEVQAGR